jgi:hypothetical protein
MAIACLCVVCCVPVCMRCTSAGCGLQLPCAVERHAQYAMFTARTTDRAAASVACEQAQCLWHLRFPCGCCVCTLVCWPSL